MVFILRIFTIELSRIGENDYELLVIFGVSGNEEHQDKEKRIYEIIFSFN